MKKEKGSRVEVGKEEGMELERKAGREEEE